ncbi:MAG: P-loop NTPase [Myxococcaceae bacterium]|nr:P-loop NTPase [Myxococcaceae bacterium]
MQRRSQVRRIIAVGGGKGGIGKTLVSVNLAVALAQRNQKVVIVDADLGGANVHTCLGIAQPQTTLTDYVERRIARLEDVCVPTSIPNLSLIGGALDALDVANLKFQQKQKLLRNLQTLDADTVVLDLGAGTSFNVLDFFLVAHHGLLVLLPEPTSIENAYRFIKSAFFRRLQDLQTSMGIEDLIETAMSTREGAVRTPLEFVARAKAIDAEAGARLERELEQFRVRLVVNQARGPGDADVGHAVVSAWRKFFGLNLDYLGAISYDDAAWRAVRKRRPLLVEGPESIAAAALRKIADNLLALDARSASRTP